MITDADVMAKSHIKVPLTTPNAYPAAISKGPPGIIARNTCTILIPIKASTPRKPYESTHSLNFSGSDTNSSSGLPTKYVRAAKKATTNTAVTIATIFFFFLTSCSSIIYYIPNKLYSQIKPGHCPRCQL